MKWEQFPEGIAVDTETSHVHSVTISCFIASMWPFFAPPYIFITWWRIKWKHFQWYCLFVLRALCLKIQLSRRVLLTQWGRMTHNCVSKLTIIGSNNGLSPGRRQAIVWTNTGILLIGPLGTNFSKILIEISKFLFTKMPLKILSGNVRPFCVGLNVLRQPFHRIFQYIPPICNVFLWQSLLWYT